MMSEKNDEVEVTVVGAESIRCVYVANYRSVGAKPWYSEHLPSRTFTCSVDELLSGLTNGQIARALAKRRKQDREYKALVKAEKAKAKNVA